MRPLAFILFLIVGLFGRPGVGYGQHAEKVAQSLAGEGFENIRALYADSSYIFTFENPVYRSVPDALRLAMQLAANGLPPESDVKILLLEKDLPRVVVSFRAGDWLSFLGGDLSLSYLLPDENWKLKLRMGLTGSSHFIDGEWMHTPVRTLTYALQGSWFIPRWNIDLEGGVRQYLYGDTGLYGSCTRWFGQTAVGFYAMAGEESFNGGFHFTFAFPVRKRPRNHLFRVTLPTHQDMVYNAGTEFYYGQDYRVGPGTNRVREFYNAAYLKNELLKK